MGLRLEAGSEIIEENWDRGVYIIVMSGEIDIPGTEHATLAWARVGVGTCTQTIFALPWQEDTIFYLEILNCFQRVSAAGQCFPKDISLVLGLFKCAMNSPEVFSAWNSNLLQPKPST